MVIDLTNTGDVDIGEHEIFLWDHPHAIKCKHATLEQRKTTRNFGITYIKDAYVVPNALIVYPEEGGECVVCLDCVKEELNG